MNIQAHPDYTGLAPKHHSWCAFDADTYDGAEDTTPPCLVGSGCNAAEAILDLIEQMRDAGEITHDEAEELCWLHSINPMRMVAD